MKKLLLLLLISTGLQAQTVDFNSFAKKSTVDSLKVKVGKQQISIDSLKAIVDGGIVKDSCVDFKIVGISGISKNGITVKYSGDVKKVRYSILNDASLVLKTDTATLANDALKISFNTAFANGSYTLILYAQDCIGTVSRKFTVNDSVLPKCDRSPTITSIYNITKTGATVQFDANNVTLLSLTLFNSSDVSIGSTTYTPNGNTLLFPYKEQNSGDYKIKITPLNCDGTSDTKSFKIAGDSGGITPIPDPIEDSNIPKFSQTPKTLIKLKNNKGTYTDEAVGDFIGDDGLRYRVENGITYRALYWITEIPLMDENGNPVDFGSRQFPNGLIPSIRKEYAAVKWDSNTELRDVLPPWRGSKNQTDFKNSGWDIWLHGGENPQAKSAYLFKTVVVNFTTNSGYDLKTSDSFVREQNPSWLDAGNLIPQFMSNPSEYKTDRAISIQNWPGWTDPYETAKRLYDGGITHAWWEAIHGAGVYKNGFQVAGLPNYKIKPAFNWASVLFKYANPELQPNQQATDDQAIKTANFITLPDSAEFTDEMSEGSYPQLSGRRNVLYSGVAKNILERNVKGSHLYGDYGYGSVNLTWNSSYGRDPMNPYYLSLLGIDGRTKLEQVGGSGHTGLKNEYFDSGQYKIRGTIIGSYYAITHLSLDRTPSMGFEAIGLNNMAPDQPRIRFSTVIMQSNANGSDVPYKSDGTIKANGEIYSGNYPETPAELLKHDSFFSCLYYKGAYLWDAVGILNHENVNDFYNSSITTDNWVNGTRVYAKLIPYLNDANRALICTDFKANGIKYNFKSLERYISNSGKVYYNNTYFNEVVNGKTGMLIRIPAKNNAFIWVNSYKRSDEYESVSAIIDGKEIYLGECAGSTLTVFYEK